MPPGYVYISLITFLIGGVFCAQNSNSGHHQRNKQIIGSHDEQIIDIDDQAFDGYSGDHGDQVDDEGSGHGGWFEDDDGSADPPAHKNKDKSMCQRLRDDLNGKKLIGAYIPRCTLIGEFEPMQCHGSTGECWCVNAAGQEVPGTMRRAPHTPNCEDTHKVVIQPPITRHPPKVHPDPDTEVQVPPQPEQHPDHPSSTDPDISYERESDKKSKLDPNQDQTNVDISYMPKDDQEYREQEGMPLETGILEKPGVLAAIIGGAVVGLLCAVLAVMFCVYRMRKKDEGSYALDDNSKRSPSLSYTRANTEYFA